MKRNKIHFHPHLYLVELRFGKGLSLDHGGLQRGHRHLTSYLPWGRTPLAGTPLHEGEGPRGAAAQAPQSHRPSLTIGGWGAGKKSWEVTEGERR